MIKIERENTAEPITKQELRDAIETLVGLTPRSMSLEEIRAIFLEALNLWHV